MIVDSFDRIATETVHDHERAGTLSSSPSSGPGSIGAGMAQATLMALTSSPMTGKAMQDEGVPVYVRVPL